MRLLCSCTYKPVWAVPPLEGDVAGDDLVFAAVDVDRSSSRDYQEEDARDEAPSKGCAVGVTTEEADD